MPYTYKPEGHPVVSPYLVVEEIDPLIAFLEEVFGGEEMVRHEDEAGGVLHAEVRIEESVIMMGEAGIGWSPTPSMLHIYVEDVDGTYERALEAGGTKVQEPIRREGESDRRCGVKDPAGNTWWIATRVEVSD